MPSIALICLLASCAVLVLAQSDDDVFAEKRAMRNALVRFGRAGGGMRNALVRFGKRSSYDDDYETASQDKRNGAPQPFGLSYHMNHLRRQKLRFIPFLPKRFITVLLSIGTAHLDSAVLVISTIYTTFFLHYKS